MQEQAIIPFTNANPLVRYEIEFVSSTPLLGIAGSSPASAVRAGIPAQLTDEFHWESHVNKADKLDYIVAVSSGVIAGLVDVFYVDEFSLNRASAWGKEQIERIVMKVARIEGYQGDSLQGAIRMLAAAAL